MSTLLLIRHGQASLHASDYDQLSPLGEKQSQRLGYLLAERNLKLDALYMGPLRRHRQTVEFAVAAAKDRGMLVPQATIVEDLAEIDVSPLTEKAMAQVLASCPNLRKQLAEGALDEQARLAMGQMAGVMRGLMDAWAAGDEQFAALEPFAAFEARVQKGLQRVMREQGRGKTVAVVTSGGPVSVAVKMALGLTPERVTALMFALVNASLSRFQYTQDSFALASFNTSGHVADIQTKI
jgi:broad specificity phosphatase PhoE